MMNRNIAVSAFFDFNVSDLPVKAQFAVILHMESEEKIRCFSHGRLYSSFNALCITLWKEHGSYKVVAAWDIID